jgi:hypothetical protein
MTYTESRKSYSIRTKNGEPIITFQDEHEAFWNWRDIEELVMEQGYVLCVDETTIVSKEIEL